MTVGCGVSAPVSVGPAMLAGERGRKFALRMPRERILTETDGPFTERKGRALFPWDAETAEIALAEIWQLGEDDTRRVLHSNLARLAKQATRSGRTK